MAGNSTFERYMLQRHGTGIGSRADAAGNHAMAAELIDAYAQAGETMPAGVADRVRQLNQITQDAAIFDAAGPSARAHLSGGSFDPVAMRAQAAQLEQELLQESAYARNITERLANQTAVQNLRTLEMQNDMAAATFDAQRDNTIATLQLSTRTAQNELAAAERGDAVAAGIQFASDNGFSIDDLENAYRSGSPSDLAAAFGTSDRMAAHAVLRQARLMEDENRSDLLNSMATAANEQAAMLAADANVSNEMLQSWLADPSTLPEDLTLLGVQTALEERQTTIASQQQFTQARVSGIAAEAELQLLAFSSLRGDQRMEILTTLAGGGISTQDLRGMLNSEQGITQLTQLIRQSSEVSADGKFTMAGPDGAPVELSVGDLIEYVQQDMQAQAQGRVTQILGQQQIDSFMLEHEETTRLLDRVDRLSGRPLPREARALIERSYHDSQALIQASLMTDDPERQAQLRDGAAQLMNNARQQAMQYMTRSGLSEARIDAILQGHFSQPEAYREAMAHVLSSQEFALRSAAIGTRGLGSSISALIQSKDFTQEQLREWQENPEGSIFDIGSDPVLGFGGNRITQEELVAAVEAPIIGVMAERIVAGMQELPGYDQISPELRNEVSEILSTVQQAEGGIAGLQRLGGALRLLDESMYEASVAEAIAQTEQTGQPVMPTYVRGQMLSQLDTMLRDGNFANTVIDEAGAGTMELYAVLGEYVRATTPGIALVGENAPAFDDLPALTIRSIFNRMGGGVNPLNAGSMAAQREIIASEVSAAYGVQPGQRVPDAETASNLRVALLNIYARKMANPDAHRNTMLFGALPAPYDIGGLGTGVPNAEGRGRIASAEELAAELERLGYPVPEQLYPHIAGSGVLDLD